MNKHSLAKLFDGFEAKIENARSAVDHGALS